jgi:hypothetical protein
MRTTTRNSPLAATAVIGEPSFADVLARVEGAPDLDRFRKRYWSTSLRQMASYLDRPPECVPARITGINGAVRKLHPEHLGVHPKTFTNHKANARAALLWFKGTGDAGCRAVMASEFRSLLAELNDSYTRDLLSPFMRYLSGLGIAPGSVNDVHVEKYADYRRTTAFSEYRMAAHRRMIRSWNACAQSIPGWPDIRLAVPAYAPRFVGPSWEEFPEGLQRDISAYLAHISHRHRTADGRLMRGCAPATIATRRRELIAAVRIAVDVGIPLIDLQSLADLLRPDRAEAILDHYWRKNGQTPSIYTIGLAARFVELARLQPGPSEDAIRQLEDMRHSLEQHRPSGLTPKNQAFVRTILQSDVWPEVLRLPRRLMVEANSDRHTMPVRSAVQAQLAVAIRILSVAPVRMQNLASIIIGINLVRPGGPGTPYTLTFPEYDVKNRVTLEFPLDPPTTEFIDRYVHDHRPVLMGGRNHDFLFPGEAHERKDMKTLSSQINDKLWKCLGLKVTPHQFRHAAAAILLKHEPGNYELVRRVLGHRNIQTTINFYIGLETLNATRRFGALVAGLELEGDTPGRCGKPGRSR